jgi:hypothetical protein
MKIAYLAFTDFNKESGVSKKIHSQIKEWISKGHTTKLFLVSDNNNVAPIFEDIDIEIISYGNLLHRLLLLNFKQVLKWKPDHVYLRFCFFYPSLKKLLRLFPTTVEINTDDLSEFKISLSKVNYIYHKFTRNILLQNVKKMVFVTNEIGTLFDKYKKEKIVIGNGIELENYYQLPVTNNKTPNLIFIGSPGLPWHGVDKIIKLANHFKDWKFHIVGYTSKDINLNIPSNVTCYGYLNKNDYENLMLISDIAIGSLALHRNDMDEACTLKVREYLAYGIPTIIGYQDTDFMEGHPYILQISNKEDSIETHKEQILKFVDEWADKRVPAEKIKHLDYGLKEEIRLSFMEKI